MLRKNLKIVITREVDTLLVLLILMYVYIIIITDAVTKKFVSNTWS